MKTAIITSFSVLALSGCAQLEFATREGADVADGVLAGAIYSTCVAPTVGSIIRRYGRDDEARAAWEIFCTEEWARNQGRFSIPEFNE